MTSESVWHAIWEANCATIWCSARRAVREPNRLAL